MGADGGEDRLMFIWPTTIVHKIDRHSPLYMLSASDMLKERFEVVCMLGKFEWIFCKNHVTQAFSKYKLGIKIFHDTIKQVELSKKLPNREVM